MSISIGHGFILRCQTLDAAFTELHALRPQVREMIRTATAKFLAVEAQTVIDMPVVKPETECEQRPLQHANRELKRRQKSIKETGYRDADVDFDFSVTLFPARGKIIGIVYAEQVSFRDWFYDLPWVDAYHYYDGSDSYLEQGISEEEWREREQMWSSALDDFRSTPAEAGISMMLGENIVLPTSLDIFAQIEAKEVRAPRYAKRQLLSKVMAEALVGKETLRGTQHITEALFAANDYIVTPAGVEEAVAIEADILARLPDITEQLLLRN